MNQDAINNCVTILQEELLPAMGCTEPIAVAYAAAKAREALGCFPQHVTVFCSGNIVKNVKSVTVPNSNGLRGIDAAATLGIVGGQADRQLEVLEEVTPLQIERTEQLLQSGFCSTRLAVGVDKLYLRVLVQAGREEASVTIQGHHTNITEITRNGTVLYEKPYDQAGEDTRKGNRDLLTMDAILKFADAVELEQIEPILARQVECNTRIADAGMQTRYGAGVAMEIGRAHV